MHLVLKQGIAVKHLKNIYRNSFANIVPKTVIKSENPNQLSIQSKYNFGGKNGSFIDFSDETPLKPAPLSMYQSKLKCTDTVEE